MATADGQREADSILCHDRATGESVVEPVPHASLLRWLYGTRSGRLAGQLICRGSTFSRLATWWSHRPGSRRRIPAFVEAFDVDMADYVEQDFATFNDFFIRQFRPGARAFVADEGRLPAWAEGVCLAWDAIGGDETFPVKGQHLAPAALLGDEERARPFLGGPMLLIRLRPQDYHRFHYAADGPIVDRVRLPGRLDSVHLLGLRQRSDILARNERQVTIQQTETHGRLAYVEVGALLVGRIVQTSDAPQRGAEKGYFEYGGSTVLMFGEPGAWRPDDDLLAQTAKRTETVVRLGEGIARAI